MANMARYKRKWNPETRRWIYEHRIIAEKKLKRKLKSSEIVHHLNGIWTDNSLKNISITTRKTHMAIHMRKFQFCQICGGEHHAKGLCNKCYMRKLRIKVSNPVPQALTKEGES